MPERTFDRTFRVGNRSIHVQKRARSAWMGRFGGGWQYKIGAQWVTSRDVIIDLLVMHVRIRKVDRDAS